MPGSNRTFMELKWSNNVTVSNVRYSSNRTFMELKYYDNEDAKENAKQF